MLSWCGHCDDSNSCTYFWRNGGERHADSPSQLSLQLPLGLMSAENLDTTVWTGSWLWIGGFYADPRINSDCGLAAVFQNNSSHQSYHNHLRYRGRRLRSVFCQRYWRISKPSCNACFWASWGDGLCHRQTAESFYESSAVAASVVLVAINLWLTLHFLSRPKLCSKSPPGSRYAYSSSTRNCCPWSPSKRGRPGRHLRNDLFDMQWAPWTDRATNWKGAAESSSPRDRPQRHNQG